MHFLTDEIPYICELRPGNITYVVQRFIHIFSLKVSMDLWRLCVKPALWCAKDSSSDFAGYCFLCKKTIQCGNNGAV